MNYSNITILIIVSIETITVASVEPMNVRENHVRKYLQKKVFQQYMQQKMGEQPMQNDKKIKKSSFKSALAKFSKCNKLRVKLMIKHRNRPRLLRRISKLSLDCWIVVHFLFWYQIKKKYSQKFSLGDDFAIC